MARYPKRFKTICQLNTKDPQKHMDDLAEEIRKHQHLYYIKNQPSISDQKFDQLLTELRAFEEKYPEFKDQDSPTYLIGSDLNHAFAKRKHPNPVLSLSNSYNMQEALAWAEKVSSKPNSLFHVQWKIDGATLVLHYKQGRLKYALTRGNGIIGDEVTNNALTIRSIPRKLKQNQTLTVRGEVYMRYKDFAAFNKKSDRIYANPRNLSAGSLKQKKSSETAKRPLMWTAFGAEFHSRKDQKNFLTEKTILAELEQIGIPLNQDDCCVPLSQLEKCIQDFEHKKPKIEFPVDGLVIKIDDLSLRKKLGATAHAPRWAIAYKFEPEIAETILQDIEVVVGRTGRITPRAVLEPVHLAGTVVRHATLHNADFIQKLDVRIGSKVKVCKRGDIIPAIEEVTKHNNAKPFAFPKQCPTCNTTLERETGGVHWMCFNEICLGKSLNRIIFFCERKQMDIADLGEESCRLLFGKKFITNLPDIYKLYQHKNEIEDLPGFGKKSVETLLAGIEASKKKDFTCVLTSLGLREVGPKLSSQLVEEGYDNFEKCFALVQSAKPGYGLLFIDGIGSTTETNAIANLKKYCQDPNVPDLLDSQTLQARLLTIPRLNEKTAVKIIYLLKNKLGHIAKTSLQSFIRSSEVYRTLLSIEGVEARTATILIEQFQNKDLQKLTKELGELGLQTASNKSGKRYKLQKNSYISPGQIWCVTGSFVHFKPREKAMEKIKRFSVAVTSSVSSRTTHLLVGANAGSKLKKAQDLGIKIVEETMFLKMLGEHHRSQS